MIAGQPSLTAWGAAVHRAVHQVRDGGRVLADPLAVRILGADGPAAIAAAIAAADAAADDAPAARGLRLLIVARAAIADAVLAATGVPQLVVLGAGLDTSAYRRPAGDPLRVFEVDHPATQGWKRALLAAAGIAEPPTLAFAPCDFERDTLTAALAAAGFDPGQPSLFSWLGVVPYLTAEAVAATLAALPARAHVVFDYPNPRDPDDAAHAELAARVARAGEVFRFAAETPALHALLARAGLAVIEDLGPADLAARFAGAVTTRTRGAHVVHAVKP